MTRVQVLIGDLDAAIERLRLALDEDERRRALTGALVELYRLRCHREGGRPLNQAHWNRAAAQRSGRVAQGISLIRGDMTHHVVKEIEPERRPLYPGNDVFPGPDLYPGKQLFWRHVSDMTAPHVLNQNDPRYLDYEQVVGGQPVLPTLVLARDFLVADPGPCA
ncbi:hypothetical protein [Nocardia sp. NPDC057030]|uniref:hypothetical protein n=1 Tax=unclassified Nocardia TaxID=2637762 RepID=UPI0036377C78